MTFTATSICRRPSTMLPSSQSCMSRILENYEQNAKCSCSFRSDPTEGDGRHIQLRRAQDGSVTLKEILRHNHTNFDPLLASEHLCYFDTAKVRIAMAILTRHQIYSMVFGGPLNHDHLPDAPIAKIYLKPAQGQPARHGSSSQPATLGHSQILARRDPKQRDLHQPKRR